MNPSLLTIELIMIHEVLISTHRGADSRLYDARNKGAGGGGHPPESDCLPELIVAKKAARGLSV